MSPLFVGGTVFFIVVLAILNLSREMAFGQLEKRIKHLESDLATLQRQLLRGNQ